MLRRFRAVLVTAVRWSLVWLPMGLVLGIISNAGPDYDLAPPPIPFFALAWTVWGAMSGGAFAIILSFAESGRTIATLSLLRTALWGALGCMTLPVVLAASDLFGRPWFIGRDDWALFAFVLASSAVVGAVCAAGTIAVLRRPAQP